MGLFNFYGNFIPNLSTLSTSHASNSCEEAFQASKKQLLSSNVLVPYEVNRELVLACDASHYGVGAVISHVMDNGEERPIAFASRTLTSSKQNYSQLVKEALGIVFGVKRFHKYFYGRHFLLWTDHKTTVPTLAAARLRRWSVILQAYDYTVKYRPSSDHANADALSRLPCNVEPLHEEAELLFFTSLDDLPVEAPDRWSGAVRYVN